MESGELIAVLIVAIILLIGTIFLCFRCWKAIGEVADDHMKPKRETRAQMIRGAVRRSFRRAAGGVQRGAGHIRNSFRRARGLPPGVPPPEEPGPPMRPYGARAGARRYPSRGPAPGPPGPVPSSSVPSVSAQTSDGPGRSDLHPAYLPKPKPPATGTQGDAPPTYQEALSHETTRSRANLVAAHNVEIHKPQGARPGPPHHAPERSQRNLMPAGGGHGGAPRRDVPHENQTQSGMQAGVRPPGGRASAMPSAPSEIQNPVQYPQQLEVPSGYAPSGMPPTTPNRAMSDEMPKYPYGVPNSPRDAPTSLRGMPQEGYPAEHSPYPRGGPNSPYHPQSPASQYEEHNGRGRAIEFSHLERDPNQSQYTPNHPGPAHTPHSPHRVNYPHPRDYAREPSKPTGSRSQREFPHLMTSHQTEANEYTQPPVPSRSYSQNDALEDDGGFSDRASRNRRLQSSTSVPRDYTDYRSHASYNRGGSGHPGGDDVDYAGYAQISASRLERDPPYSPTSGGYHNEAFANDSSRMRLPGDGGNPNQTHPGGNPGYLDVSQSPYSGDRGPLPPVPQRDASSWGRYPQGPPVPQSPPGSQAMQYNSQRGVVFPPTDRRFMDSDTYI